MAGDGASDGEEGDLKREEERSGRVGREGRGRRGRGRGGRGGREGGEGGRGPFVSVRCQGGSSYWEGTAFRSQF